MWTMLARTRAGRKLLVICMAIDCVDPKRDLVVDVTVPPYSVVGRPRQPRRAWFPQRRHLHGNKEIPGRAPVLATLPTRPDTASRACGFCTGAWPSSLR